MAAETLYGVTGNAGSPALYTINPITGAATLVGLLGGGFTTITAIAYDAVTDKLFGISGTGAAPTLISINRTTGAATSVATMSGTGSMTSPGMAFKSGQLYAWNESATDQLATVDKVTGAWVNLGASSLVSPANTGAGYNPADGVMYIKTSLTFGTINLVSGVYTLSTLVSTGPATTPEGVIVFSQAGTAYTLVQVSAESMLATFAAARTSWSWIGSTGVASMNCLAFIPTTAVTPTRQPIPPTTTLAPQTPCLPQSEVSNGGKGKFGCNNGGEGWTSSYAGPYGTVPQHEDPVDGETLTGKELAGIEVWLRFYHRSYPSATVTMLQRAMVELADPPAYEFGRKPEGLLSVGDIEHAIANESGGLEAPTVDIELTDAIDQAFRVLLEDQELEGDELMILMASDRARRAA